MTFRTVAVTLCTVVCVNMATAQKGSKPRFKTFEEQLSYAIGLDIAENLTSQGIKFDPKLVAAAMAEYAKDSSKVVYKKTQRDSIFQEYGKLVQQKTKEKKDADKKINEEVGKKFLEENGKKEGVVTTPSGLQYKKITEGDGVSKPTASNTVKVHYKGTLINGTTFDSSYDRGEPISFPLSGVIAGWTEGLQYMSKGSKYMLYIPANLAYGDNPPPGSPIQAGMVLIFEVELLDIE